MTFPNEWLSLFDGEKPLKAQNTTSWNTPYVNTKCTLAADPFEFFNDTKDKPNIPVFQHSIIPIVSEAN
jgi:hypothetical protein